MSDALITAVMQLTERITRLEGRVETNIPILAQRLQELEQRLALLESTRDGRESPIPSGGPGG